jgi:hypothetical protein
MKGFSEQNFFSPIETQLFRRATAIVSRVEDVAKIRCHELVRAAGRVLDLEVQDGSYGFVEHSWLWTSPLPKVLGEGLQHDEHVCFGFPNILDVYCPGQIPMVRLLFCRETALPHVGWSYRPAWRPRTDIDWKIVDALEKEMRLIDN